jgi:hypothetical protein
MSSKDLISRAPVRLVKLKMDYCTRAFGVDPCLAVGTKCFNTYFTCKYLTAYNDEPKTYNFVSSQINVNELLKTAHTLNPVRPFVKAATIRETELSEEKTITSQATIDMLDAWDNDLDIDPYWSDRSYANVEAVKGTFWKKFIARNPNYAGRAVEIYDGFLGDAEETFTRTFAGTIKEIKKNNDGSFRIECADYLESLNDIKYPVDYGMKLTSDMPAIFTALNEAAMLSLSDAVTDDICIRQDFLKMYPDWSGGGTGSVEGRFYYYIAAFDSNDNPIGLGSRGIDNRDDPDNPQPVVSVISLFWDAVSGASNYKIYRRSAYGYTGQYGGEEYIGETAALTYDDDLELSNGTPSSHPAYAARFYQLTDPDYTQAANWQSIASSLSVDADDTSILTAIGASSGYLKIDKEIIGYTGISGNTLTGVSRGLFDTNSDYHKTNSDVCIIVKRSPGNPFTHLLDLLKLAKIPDTSISSRFAAYRDAYSGISFSLLEVLKDMKLGDIFFNLVNSLDCYSWVNEAGEIDIKYKSDLTVTRKINDSDTIIKNSVSVDLNDEARLTRLLIYYERDVIDEALDEPQAYARGMQSKDIDLEKTAFKDIIDKEMFFAWVNYAGNDPAAVDAYMEDITEAKINRVKTAPVRFDLSVEIKDMDLKTADIVELMTDEIQDIYGVPIADVKYQIMKRTPDADNRIKLTIEKRNG